MVQIVNFLKKYIISFGSPYQAMRHWGEYCDIHYQTEYRMYESNNRTRIPHPALIPSQYCLLLWSICFVLRIGHTCATLIKMKL